MRKEIAFYADEFMDKLNIAMVGIGRRGSTGWLPVINALEDQVKLVAVCNTGAPRGEEMASKYQVNWFKNVEKMLDETRPDIVSIAVTPSQTHIVAKSVLERGISLITETPIASALSDADMMIDLAKQSGAKIEVAENLYRAPQERLKRQLILDGVFGKVWRAQNDNRTHNYHAVSLIRSYIGFDEPIENVIGVNGDFPVENHLFRGNPINRERTSHAIIKFSNGAWGFHNFSSLTFGSPLRNRSSTFFFAERGMGWDNELIIYEDEAKAKTLKIERISCHIDGVEVLDKLIAGEFVWDNPFKKYKLSEGQVSLASELMSLVKAVRDNVEPEYGALNGRLDREVDLAINKSHSEGNIPVKI